jgi:transcriptional regulator with XRE-family HTH domain
MKTTAEIVKQIRQQQGWTQAELGDRLGVGRSQICNIETGVSDLPASKLLQLISEAGWGIVSY